MEATVVFTTIPEIYFMHFLMTDVSFERVRMRRRRLALRCTSTLPTALPRLSRKRKLKYVLKLQKKKKKTHGFRRS